MRDSAMLNCFVNPTGGEHRVLLVSEDGHCRDYLGSILEAKGFRLEGVSGWGEARRRMHLLGASIVLADLGPDLDRGWTDQCQQLLSSIQSSQPSLPLIVLTPAELFDRAVELLQNGAADFLMKPFSAEELLRRVAAALLAPKAPAAGAGVFAAPAVAATAAAEREQPRYPGQPPADMLPPDLILGRSTAIQRVIEQVCLIAPKNTTVLITGETGTGKERVARAIHSLSHRRGHAMVSVNCGGIPANLLEDEFFGHVKGAFTDAYQTRVGRFEQAHSSTIFLDEIGDLPLELQPKLLRVLQEREIHRIGGVDALRVDARVIAATNVDLWRRVAEARFREDLFYRINVFPIHLPPLRDRHEDIPLFVEHFLARFCRRDGLRPKRLLPSAESDLMARPWPGNIRELENAVEIAVIRSRNRTTVEVGDFPEPRHAFGPSMQAPSVGIEDSADFKQLVSRFEHDLIVRVLERTHGNKTQAAEVLRLKRTTLIEKLKKFRSQQEDAAHSVLL